MVESRNDRAENAWVQVCSETSSKRMPSGPIEQCLLTINIQRLLCKVKPLLIDTDTKGIVPSVCFTEVSVS